MSEKEFVRTNLEQAGSIHYGEFVYASGEKGGEYVDIRALYGYPEIFSVILKELSEKISDIEFNSFVGIPTAGLPLATGLSLECRKPFAYFRGKPKEYGLGKRFEGALLKQGDKVIIVDDVITTGGSKEDAIRELLALGVEITAILVVVDRREKPGEDFLGIQVLSLLTLDEIKK